MAQGKVLVYFGEGEGALLAGSDASQRTLSQIGVFQLIQVLEDRFSRIKGLCTPGAPGKCIETFFDVVREPDS